MNFAIKDDANKSQALTVIPDDILSLISGGKRDNKGGGSRGGGGSKNGREFCNHDRESVCSRDRCHDRSSSICSR